MLVPAIARITARFGRAPTAVTPPTGVRRGQGRRGARSPRDASGWPSPGGASPAPPARRSGGVALHEAGQVAHRLGGAHIPSQARLRLGAFARRRHRRHPGPVRVGRARAQCHQGQRPPSICRHGACSRRLGGLQPRDRPGNPPVTKTRRCIRRMTFGSPPLISSIPARMAATKSVSCLWGPGVDPLGAGLEPILVFWVAGRR
jgi:hypothetical protein